MKISGWIKLNLVVLWCCWENTEYWDHFSSCELSGRMLFSPSGKPTITERTIPTASQNCSPLNVYHQLKLVYLFVLGYMRPRNVQHAGASCQRWTTSQTSLRHAVSTCHTIPSPNSFDIRGKIPGRSQHVSDISGDSCHWFMCAIVSHLTFQGHKSLTVHFRFWLFSLNKA